MPNKTFLHAQGKIIYFPYFKIKPHIIKKRDLIEVKGEKIRPSFKGIFRRLTYRQIGIYLRIYMLN